MSGYKEIYKVTTQEDYDALMVELEEKGYLWISGGEKPTHFNANEFTDGETVVYVKRSGGLTYSRSINEASSYVNPHRVIHYKAPKKQDISTPKTFKSEFDDITNTITMEGLTLMVKSVNKSLDVNLNTDDKTVRIINFNGKNIVKITEDKITTTSQLNNIIHTLSRINLLQLSHDFQNSFNWSILTNAWFIPLPELVTSDGRQQYLTLDDKENTYFASRFDKRLKQTFTESEMEEVPEMYKQFAVYGNLEKENE